MSPAAEGQARSARRRAIEAADTQFSRFNAQVQGGRE